MIVIFGTVLSGTTLLMKNGNKQREQRYGAIIVHHITNEVRICNEEAHTSIISTQLFQGVSLSSLPIHQTQIIGICLSNNHLNILTVLRDVSFNLFSSSEIFESDSDTLFSNSDVLDFNLMISASA